MGTLLPRSTMAALLELETSHLVWAYGLVVVVLVALHIAASVLVPTPPPSASKTK